MLWHIPIAVPSDSDRSTSKLSPAMSLRSPVPTEPETHTCTVGTPSAASQLVASRVRKTAATNRE